SLDNQPAHGTFCAPHSCTMSKVCTITGSRPTRGSVIHRRGMAKKKGGVGRHVTKNVSRLFVPNLHEHRIWVPELKKFVRVRVTARGLKTINKNGAHKSLKKTGATTLSLSFGASTNSFAGGAPASTRSSFSAAGMFATIAFSSASSSGAAASAVSFAFARGRSSEPSLNSIT